MTPITFLLLVAGLVLLVIGAEFLVKGASRIAAILGIPPLIIGLTVVAYGTGAPEMAVNVMSSFAGQADIGVGNVIGSNIFNILFILGISALVAPLIVTRQLIRSDVPITIGVSLLLLLFSLDRQLSRVDSIILFAGGIAYTFSLIYQSSKQKDDVNNLENDEFAREYSNSEGVTRSILLKNLVFVFGGLGLLVLGSRWLVNSAIAIARSLGLSELIIGLTIVSVGTSLPELVTSVVASLRGERDIAVGNVLGSNIFNILVVLGVSGIVAPESIPVSIEAIQFDIPVAIAVAFACLPIFYSGRRIDRWEGALFLFYYAAYTGYLVLYYTKNRGVLSTYIDIMLWFVLPLTFITLIVITIQEKLAARKKRERSS
ncbi:MAG: calcium/sodium antiporter [Pleurocapsa sp.]